MALKTYLIPIIYSRITYKNVEAESLQEAAKIAVDEFLSEPDYSYIEDSWELDNTLSEEYNEPLSHGQLIEDVYK